MAMEVQGRIQGNIIICNLRIMIKAQIKELKSSKEQQRLG